MSGARFFLSCGEPSGEAYAAGIARALRAQAPEAGLWGLGGELLAREGVRLVARYGELAVIGVAEALAALPRAWRLRRRLVAALAELRPDALVCVDFKEFNLSLARAAKGLGIPVVFFVGPQVWAWRPGRAKVFARHVDKLALLFPFEERYYEGLPVDARFVGHPRVAAAREAAPAFARFPALGLDPARPLLLLQPGSRPREIAALGPVMLGAFRLLRREIPALQAAVLAPPRVAHPWYREAGDAGVPVVREDAMGFRKAARASLVASGTATLETALAGCPAAILYRLSPVSYWLGRRLVRTRWVGMPNILLGEEAFPELLQEDATPERAAAAVRPWLVDDAAREALRARLARLPAMLDAGGDPLAKVAGMALEAAGLVGAR